MEINSFLVSPPDSFRSDAIDQRIDIVRQLQTAGRYHCEVTKNGRDTSQFTINVEGTGAGVESIEIDLSELSYSTRSSDVVNLEQDGYVLFYSGWGDDTYSIVVSRNDELVLTTDGLSDGELIVVTPMQPGRYAITDLGSGANCDVSVKPIGHDGDSDEDISARYEDLQSRGAKKIEILDGKFSKDTITVVGDQPVIIQSANETVIRGKRKRGA